MNRTLKFLILAVSLVIIAGIGVLSLVYVMNQPVEGIGRDGVVFKVAAGDTLAGVAGRLEDEGLIRSSLLLRGIGRVYNTGGKLKTGLYRIEPDFTTLRIHNLLVTGSQVLFKVTIPEGWTARMIANRMEQEGITGSEEFLAACSSPELLELTGSSTDSVEGFLYPDTYYFASEYPATAVVEHMVQTFFDKMEEIYPEWEKMDRQELYRKVILASIVEREYRSPEEAPLIASVFYNRLKENMTLGSCATVVYVLTEQMGEEHPERLTYSDLEVESDYNTYRIEGLPPGPIANPGYVALHAAFHPEESDYFYFVLKDPAAGMHHFSKSLGEHNKAYSLYIKSNYR